MTGREIHFENSIRELTPLDSDFPSRLRDIPDCPRTLYVRGTLPPEDSPSVAIIGARDGTDYGLDVARTFGRMLASRGVAIISGMAYGIDAAGQWGAIDGHGRTWAVFGCGLNICYPQSNYLLYDAILENGGGLLSEHPLDTAPLPRNFASRNRIISGLADAVLVIEAKERSGTFLTVNRALEQGRQVFALPGRITDRLSAGCNRLIREGAELLSSVEDVLEYLHLRRNGMQTQLAPEPQALSEKQRTLLSVLDFDVRHIDQILSDSHLTIQEASLLLTELEILGFVEMPKNGWYRKKLTTLP